MKNDLHFTYGGMGERRSVLLVFPFPFLSHYLRCIVLARALSAEYDVLFLDHPDYSDFVKQEGFGLFSCSRWETAGLVEQLKHFDFSWLNENALGHHCEERFLAIRKYRPAAVIGDNDPAVKIAASRCNVPYVSLLNSYLSKYFAGVRSLSSRHPAYRSLGALPKSWRDGLTRIGERSKMKELEQPFTSLRRKFGLPSLPSYRDELEGDVNLLCDPSGLFPLTPLPENYIVIGSLIYNPPGEAQQISLRPDPTRATIFVNMGSSGDWDAVKFLNDPFYRQYNIVTAGDSSGALEAIRTANFTFLAASAIMPHADLVICHGGNGIIQQCLYYGVPALCKTSYFEQEWNVQALERIGGGASLDNITDATALRKIVALWINGQEE